MVGCANLFYALKKPTTSAGFFCDGKHNSCVAFQWLQQSTSLQKLFSSFAFAVASVEDSAAPAT